MDEANTSGTSRTGGTSSEVDTIHEFGAPDVDALGRIRDRFERHEPLVDRTAFDSSINPTTLHVLLADGIEDAGRFDIRWSDRGYYSFHYREPAANLACRFDRHPKPETPEKHFHPPPDASADARHSCIDVELPELVALAVCQAWRYAYDAGDLESINSIDDPP